MACPFTTGLKKRRAFLALLFFLPVLAPAAEAQVDFDLPKGGAEVTLKLFVQQSGEEVVYLVDPVRGIQTAAVKGRMTAYEALRKMLAGTTLGQSKDPVTGALAIAVRPLPQARARASEHPDYASSRDVVHLSPFEVRVGANEGYIASDTLSGSRVAAKIFDVPATVSVITRDLLDDMGAVDPWQALSKAVAGVQTFGAPGVFSGASIRGFRAQFWAVDGATTASVGPTSNFNMDGLEVIKGPSALLYGPFGAYGGYVNMMPKWARRNPVNKVEVSVGTDSFYSGMIDVGQEFLNHNRMQVRVVLGKLSYDRPGFADTDFTHSLVFAPSLTYEINPKVKLKMRAEYNKREYLFSHVPLGLDGVPIRELSANQYFPNLQSEDEQFFTQTQLTGSLSDEWSFKFQFVTEIDHYKNDSAGFTARNVVSQDSMTIYQAHGDYMFKQWTIDMSTSWDKLDFGPGLNNHLVVATTINNWTNNYRWNANTLMAGLYPEYQMPPWTGFSVSNPPALGSAAANLIATARADTQNNLYQPYNTQWLGGVMATDTFEMFNGKLKLNFGTRYNYDERYHWTQTQTVKNAGLAGSPAAATKNTIFLYRYGAVYQPTKNIGVYIGHDEGYLAVGPIFKADGSALVPETGENDEIGVKIDNLHALGGYFYGSLSYFRLKVHDKWRGDPYNPGFFIQDGLQENNGWDGQIGYTSDNKKLTALAGFFKADGPTQAFTGTRAAFVPKETMNFWLRYNITDAFAVGGGWKHIGDSLDGTALITSPAYNSGDVFAEYRQKLSGKRQLIYRLGVTNVSDGLNMYFLSAASAAFLEDARQTKLTVSYLW